MTTQGSSIKGTFSCWFKLANDNLTGGFLSHYFSGSYNFDICMQLGHIEVADYRLGYILRKRTTAKYRDLNAWYHLYVAIDRSLTTASDRCKIYVNGERVTDFQSAEDQDYSQQTSGSHTGNISMNNNYTARVGVRYDTTYFNGSISHMHWVDGSVIDISQFGSTDSTTGEWKINTSPSVSYGTNGHFILKDGNSTTDQSGNNISLTTNGTLTKTEDCPSNVFATLNALDNFYVGGTFSNGNTTVATDVTKYAGTYSTIGASSGKYYCEMKKISGNANARFGILSRPPIDTGANSAPGNSADSVGYYSDTGQYYINKSATSYGATYGNGDIIGVAMDLDNNKLYFSKNGTWQNSGDPTSGATGTGAINIPTATTGYYHFAMGDQHDAESGTYSINFGNGYFGTTAVSSAGTNASGIGIFEYDVPTGYTALSTKGLNE
jgi:hypothetical protein